MESKNSVLFCQSELPCLSFAIFEDMRKKGEFCDFTVTVEGYTFTAHRVVIAAVIPSFRFLFTSEEECIKEITLGHVDPQALGSLIDFAYSSNINICDDNVHSLLMTSHFLQLYQVKDACEEYLLQRLHVDNVLKIRSAALRINNSNLTESTSHYIVKNFEEFSKCDDFLSLPSSYLKEIISKDNLNVFNEKTVFEAIMKWVRFSPSTRHSMLPELLSEVRLIYLSHDYLTDRVLPDELISQSNLCLELIDEVKTYSTAASAKASSLCLKTCPRKIGGIYTVCYSYTSGISVYHADVANSRWHHLASEMQCDLVYHVVAANEKIYMFLDETIHTFSPRSLEWEQLPTRHQFLCGSSVSYHDDIIYCFGSVHHNFRDKMRFFDTQQGIWLHDRSMEKGHCNSAAATLESSIYVTGGCHRFLLGRKFPSSSSGSKTVQKYSTLTRQWSEVASMLTARERHGCVGLNAKLYVCGGYNAVTNQYSLTAEIYDPLTRQWKFISEMKRERTTVSLVLNNGKIFAFGNNNEDPVPVEMYDPETVQWEFSFSGLQGFSRTVSLCSSRN